METVFSILTFLQNPSIEKIVVVANAPEYLELVHEKVTIEYVSDEEWDTWVGVNEKKYYKKIKGIERVIRNNPGKDVFFVDSDTFCGKDITPLRDVLANGGIVMGDPFGRISKALDKDNRKVFRLTSGKKFSGMTVTEDTKRFNSGTIGLPHNIALELITQCATVCDELYGLTKYHASEEIAFSFVLQSYGPVANGGTHIGHYWGNKLAWDDAIRTFFAYHALRKTNLDELIHAANGYDFSEIPTYVHTPRRHKNLRQLANRFWPQNRHRYFPEQPVVG